MTTLPTTLTTTEGIDMNKLSTTLVAALLAIGSVSAFAADEMKKDGMAKDGMAKDGMNKGSMSK